MIRLALKIQKISLTLPLVRSRVGLVVELYNFSPSLLLKFAQNRREKCLSYPHFLPFYQRMLISMEQET